MNIPLQVTFRDMDPSDAIEGYVRTKAEKLERFAHPITRCRVMVESPHRHHAKGKQYHVRIDLIVPGEELVISRNPDNAVHEDVYACIDDAFDDAQRVLQDHQRRRRDHVKHHGGNDLR